MLFRGNQYIGQILWSYVEYGSTEIGHVKEDTQGVMVQHPDGFIIGYRLLTYTLLHIVCPW